MRNVKLMAVALMLTLTGVVYAAGYVQDAGHAHGSAAKASCCKAHDKGDKQTAAQSCDKDGKGCCKAHKAGAAEAVSVKDGEGCCAGGGCCSGGSCSKGHKKTADATYVEVSDKSGESCCAGSDCCKDCACCQGHKTMAKHAAAAQHKEGEGCCACCGMGHEAAK